MPRTAGIYSLPPVYKATSGQTIKTEQHNPPLEDIASALTGSLSRDGSAPMTGNLPMNSQRITGLAEAINAGDAVRRDQVTLYSAWLSSVAALAMEANTLPYATGAGTSAKTPLTGFARTLIDDADAATARDTLELSTEFLIDEDDFASDSATRPPSQQSTKAYVAASALGVGQSWQDMSGSRTVGTTYQNSTGKPIMASIEVFVTGGGIGLIEASEDGVSWVDIFSISNDRNIPRGGQFIVPPGHRYRVTGVATIQVWSELR